MIEIYHDDKTFIVRDPGNPGSVRKPYKQPKRSGVDKKLQALVDAGTHKFLPMADYAADYSEKRCASIADGGYGTVEEQLELLGEEGIGKFQAHIAQVKLAHPKPSP